MKNNIFVSATGTFFCFIFMLYGLFSLFPEKGGVVASYFLYPALYGHYYVTHFIQNLLEKRKSIAELQEECLLLKKENQHLYNENIALIASERYGKGIDEIAGFKHRYNRPGERIVHVLARHFSSDQHFFLVNAGARHGVHENMIALYGNTLIGKVVEVYPWYCKVCLVTDRTCKVGCILTKTGARGVHEGANSLFHSFVRHVSHLEKVENNDIVLSNGEGLIFPQGFLIGSVACVESGDLFYTISVKLAVDFTVLQYCSLVSKNDNELVSLN